MRLIRKLVRSVRPGCLNRDDHSLPAAMFSCAADVCGGTPLGAHQSFPTRSCPRTFRRGDARQRRFTDSQQASFTGTPACEPLFSLQNAVRPDPSEMAKPMLHSGTGSAAQPMQTVRPPPGCQAPLCERHAQHVVAADALRAWRQSAISAIEEVGDAHAAQDGGSTSRELKA